MFILWYSASSTFGKDSDIVMGVRAQQKEKTRRSLVEELLDNVVYGGVASYLERAEESNVNLFI